MLGRFENLPSPLATGLALAVILAFTAPAAAQQADFSVTQGELPAGEEVRAGSSAAFDVDVELTGQGFACTSDVEVPVNVTIEAEVESSAPDGANVAASDDELTFVIPAGQYELEPYNDSAQASVQADTDSGVTQNYSATLTVISEFSGGTYDACAPSEFPSAASDPAEISLDVIRDQAPEPEEDEQEDDPGEEPVNDTPEDQSDEEEDGIPFPAGLAPLALALVGLLAPRRRDGG